MLFDAIKAQREIVTGISDAHKVIGTRAMDAERRLGEAEAEYNALALIGRLIGERLDEERAKLRALEAEAEARSKGEGHG